MSPFGPEIGASILVHPDSGHMMEGEKGVIRKTFARNDQQWYVVEFEGEVEMQMTAKQFKVIL